ncbi:MAG TPA: sugar phosphate isomerase/epimerase family protein [Planctomycetaceae bacterium]|nr:sugar phosphate isomerase/epimerase family protein [Planctomycetaceae bacterium]
MKFAICQEMYESTDWATQCRLIAEAGYTGIEVAPFSIGADLASVPTEVLDSMRLEAEKNGLEIIGLHWLLARTTGLYLTSPEPSVRKATADYLALLARVCRRLGGHIMVFGSPQQRSLLPGISKAQAVEYAVDVFRQATSAFADNDVLLCLEPLTPKETDFINTCDEAIEIIQRVNHPTMALHQDVKAMLGAEEAPIPKIIHRHKKFCKHFHVNDSNLLGPGMGSTDYHPILRALIESNYSGWVSVEVFDYSPGAQNIAVTSLNYMRSILDDLRREGVTECV